MKKLATALLSLSLITSMTATSFASDTNFTIGTEGTSSEYLSEPTNIASINANQYTIADVDALLEQYSEANLTSNVELKEKIDEQLTDMGVEKISLDEIQKLTGEISKPYAVTSQSNIEFRTAYSSIVSNGKTVQIMRIYAIPSEGSDMFHYGVVEKDATKSGLAKTLKLVNIWGNYAAGFTKAGPAVSLYDALHNTITTLTQNSQITRVRASYDFTCIENTVFLYFKNTSGNWTQMGISSSLGYSVTAIAKSVYINNNNALPKHTSRDYTGTLQSSRYNDASYMYNNYAAGNVNTESQFTKFHIAGVTGNSSDYVAEAMLCPNIPATCS